VSVRLWRALTIVRRIIAWGLLPLVSLALAFPESWEPLLTRLPKLQFGQMAAGWFSAGTALAVPVLVMGLLTIVLGRFFCGWLCPLGASMDLVRLLREKIRRGRLSYVPDRPWRSLIPILIWGAFWIGVSIPMGELEPYAVVAAAPTVWLVVLAVSAWRGRAFCNSVCPTGWLLKLLSTKTLLALKIDPAGCRGCGACQRACPARCVDHERHLVDTGRCLLCLECAAVCRFRALSYGRPQAPAKEIGAADPRRRGFLRLAGAAALAGGSWLSGEEARLGVLGPPEATPILPPGAFSIAKLAAHCTSCHTCVRVCPNGALDSSHEGGAILLSKPVLDPYQGFCQYDCVLCGLVCPTGALTPLTPEVKRTSRIGLAALTLSECVVIKNGTSCGACAELCPTGAVSMREGPTGLLEPRLDPAYCIGCGACQNACPVRPISAITVTGLSIQQTAATPVVVEIPDEVLEEFPF
jgi:ferredoxin